MSDNFKVMFIDDNQQICQMAKAMLHRDGISVDIAVNGGDALAALKNSATTYDVLVIDANLGDMDGLQLYQRVKLMLPEQRVVFTSGYLEEDILPSHMRGRERIGFLSKPFTRDTLLDKLNRTRLAG